MPVVAVSRAEGGLVLDTDFWDTIYFVPKFLQYNIMLTKKMWSNFFLQKHVRHMLIEAERLASLA